VGNLSTVETSRCIEAEKAKQKRKLVRRPVYRSCGDHYSAFDKGDSHSGSQIELQVTLVFVFGRGPNPKFVLKFPANIALVFVFLMLIPRTAFIASSKIGRSPELDGQKRFRR
jgi:hypothetical protein